MSTSLSCTVMNSESNIRLLKTTLWTFLLTKAAIKIIIVKIARFFFIFPKFLVYLMIFFEFCSSTVHLALSTLKNPQILKYFSRKWRKISQLLLLLLKWRPWYQKCSQCNLWLWAFYNFGRFFIRYFSICRWVSQPSFKPKISKYFKGFFWQGPFFSGLLCT